jgi:hypothetical protein
MIKPIIHLNGTSGQELADGYLAAYTAVNDALDAIRQIEFNARDYYPIGMDKWVEAQQEMTARIAALQKVSTEFLDLAIHCQNIVDARAARSQERYA